MKYHTLLKQFQQMFWIGTIVVLTATISSVATMYHVSNLPADQYEYMQASNRWANWPTKECYSETEIELILNGPNNEQNEKTHTSSVASKLVQPKR